MSATLAFGFSVISVPAAAGSVPTELFISEYIEGGSYNKAIEIYNGTGAAVDLSDYQLELYSNGSTTISQSQILSGTIADGDVWVICHKKANAAILAVADLIEDPTKAINFNGDDGIVLRKISTGLVVDAIGQHGVRVNWPGGGKDKTQVRKLETQGDTNFEDAFTFATEWDTYAKDTVTYLGSHIWEELAPLEVTVNLDPDTLNLKSRGKWITAYIEVTGNGYDATNIDQCSLVLVTPVMEWVEVQETIKIYPTDDSHVTEGFPDEVATAKYWPYPPGVRYNMYVGWDTLPAVEPPEAIVISEVFYDQKSPSGDYNEFVELYNPTDSDVDIANWMIKAYNQTGSLQNTVTIVGDVSSTTIIASHGYYLIGNQVTLDQDKPTADLDYSISVDQTSGKNTNWMQNGAGDYIVLEDGIGTYVDGVRWGTKTSGADIADDPNYSDPSSGRSIERKSGPVHDEAKGNGYDTNDASNDFRTRSLTEKPQPQNSASPTETPPDDLVNVPPETPEPEGAFLSQRAYLMFDLSAVGDLDSAVLKVYNNYAPSTGIPDFIGKTIVVDAKEVAVDTWDETTLTWNNAPTMGSVLGTVTVNAGGQWWSFDVETYIASELAGDGTASIGLMSQNEGTDDAAVWFYTKDAGESEPRVHLEITHTIEVEVPITVDHEDDSKYGFVSDPQIIDRDANYVVELMVKFDRQALTAALDGLEGTDVDLYVTGAINGESFESAIDTIRVIKPGKN